LLGLVFWGVSCLALNVYATNILLQAPRIVLYSNFKAKPMLVVYVDFNPSSPPDTTPKKRVQNPIHQSQYHEVIQIHPITFQVLPGTTRNITSIHWTWEHHSVALMGDQPPQEIDWTTYIYPSRDPFEEEAKKHPCQLPHEWMKLSFPTCNNLHALDMMGQLLDSQRRHQNFLMGTGSVRSAWLLEHNTGRKALTEQSVLKTLRMIHDFDQGNLDRHRRDALISERLTASPHILNIYGYCGNSAIYQYAKGGTLFDAIGAREFDEIPNDPVAHKQWEHWTSRRKVDVAFQVVSALAALNDIDHDGRPSVAHDDLDVTQLVSTDGGKTFKLSDFNGAPFIAWNAKEQESCAFRPLMRGGKTRSPEEYDQDIQYVTDKIDIFALGNILYTIVEGEYPYRNIGSSDAIRKVMEGIWPELRKETRKSKDPVIQALLRAMSMCWNKDPSNRASARQILDHLRPHVERTK
jgi:Protein kinase domain